MAQVRIPWDALSHDALVGVIEEFVTREGTEYGRREISLEAKCESILKQLKSGDVVITWDDDTQSCSIEPVNQAP